MDQNHKIFETCDSHLEKSLFFVQEHQSYLHRLRLTRDQLVENLTLSMIQLDSFNNINVKKERKQYIIAIQDTIERLEELFTKSTTLLKLMPPVAEYDAGSVQNLE